MRATPCRYRTAGSFPAQAERLLDQARLSDASVRERLNYYNTLRETFTPSAEAVPVSRLRRTAACTITI